MRVTSKKKEIYFCLSKWRKYCLYYFPHGSTIWSLPTRSRIWRENI